VSVKPMAELTAIGTALLAGGEIDLNDSDDQISQFYPEIDMQRQRETFSQAVIRAKGWRQ